MRKFNQRESYVLITALETQRDETVAQIEKMEAEGKNSIFAPKYIKDEHNALIKAIKEHTLKNKGYARRR